MTNEAHLPESVRRQIAEAEELERQLYGQPAPEDGNTEVEQSAPVEEAPQAVEQPAEQEVQPEPRKDDEEAYRRRYDVLRGKYEAEVPRLHAQVKELTQNFQLAMQELQQLKAQKEQVKPEEPDKDAELFGEDLIEAVDRRAERKAAALVAKQTEAMQAYVKQLEAKLGTVDQQVAVNAQDRFYNRLAHIVPDYQSVNEDQGFLGWLGEVDPIYGVPRQAALDAAAQSLDADRTAAIFAAYKSLTGQQVQTQQKQQVRQELARQVAPSRAQSAAPTTPQKRIWSQSEYEQAYDPRNIRVFGQAKADAMVAEAEAALAEGRVRF